MSVWVLGLQHYQKGWGGDYVSTSSTTSTLSKRVRGTMSIHIQGRQQLEKKYCARDYVSMCSGTLTHSKIARGTMSVCTEGFNKQSIIITGTMSICIQGLRHTEKWWEGLCQYVFRDSTFWKWWDGVCQFVFRDFSTLKNDEGDYVDMDLKTSTKSKRVTGDC